MRDITDINPEALDKVDTIDLIHGEIMNAMVEAEEKSLFFDQFPSQHNRAYFNGRMDALIGVYGLINDIQWYKTKLEREI
jgi:hypothetical protein